MSVVRRNVGSKIGRLLNGVIRIPLDELQYGKDEDSPEMSSNAKQQGKANASVATFQQGQRNLRKRDFKQALKDARICYRQSPINEHRILLEQSSIGRARELEEAGLKPQACDILQELLAQPVIDADVRKELPELLSRLGMLERYPQYRQQLDADPALKARMLTRSADFAVLRLGEAKDADPEIRHGAALVLASLDKLDEGLESDSMELLKDIARQSPFADWRLFVRGLAAHYRKDQANSEANWGRLDPDRMPARITRLLTAFSQADKELPSDPNLANALAALEGALWGSPLLSGFRQLKARAGAGEWIKAVAVLRHMRDRLRVADPLALEAITDYLRNQAIRSADRELLKELTLHADPLPWDPNWNHARAQLLELDRNSESNDEVNAWQKYLADLDQVRCWTQDDIRLAKAITLTHIGKIFVSLVQEYLNPEEDGPGTEADAFDPSKLLVYEAAEWDYDLHWIPREFFEHKAEQALELSLEFRPDLRETHQDLCLLWEFAGNADRAAQARARLLSQFPDDLDSLDKLAKYHESKNEFSEALAVVSRILQAKPLDEQYRRRCWSLRMSLARQALLRTDVAAATEQLDAAKPFNADRGQEYTWLLRRALVEREKGNTEGYQRLLDEATQAIGSPVVVWFAMTAEVAMLSLPNKLYQSYEERFLEGLAAPFDAQAAGWLAEFANWLADTSQKYTGQVKHFKALSDYLKLGKKSTFELASLRQICTFLYQQKGTKTLLDHYLKHGRGRFRQSGFFSACLGMVNFQLGPKKCDRGYVKKMLLDAQAKITASDDPVERLWLPEVQRVLSFLEDFEEDVEDFEDDFMSGFAEELESSVDIDEFSRVMREELDKELARKTKPGMTVAKLSPKDFSRIMTPPLMTKVCENIKEKMGLDEATVTVLFTKMLMADLNMSYK